MAWGVDGTSSREAALGAGQPAMSQLSTFTVLFTRCYPVRSAQALSRVWLFATPWITACQGLPVHHQLPEFTQTHPSEVRPIKSCLEETNTWKRSAPRLNSCVTFGTSAPTSPHVQWGSWAPLLAYSGGKMGLCVWRVLSLSAQWWMVPAVPAAAAATITLTCRWMQPKPGTEKEAQCWETRGEQG